MIQVGGYFELELDFKKEFHENAIRLNTARNALIYLLLSNNYTKVYLPFFTCEVLFQSVSKIKFNYECYHINENFEPIFDFSKIGNGEAFLYTNYFGTKDSYIKNHLSGVKNLIIDNAQAFFSKPLKGVDTFYSARKFFGVSDGAYLYTNKKISKKLPKDYSYGRFEHLLKRIDINAQQAYSNFLSNEEILSELPLMQMSELTQKILGTINYDLIAIKRRANFDYLAKHLKSINKMNFQLNNDSIPMVYSFFSDNLSLRNILIENQIYTAQYWKETCERVTVDSVEYNYITKLIHLPIDQRYTKTDLDKIINIIKYEHYGQ